MHRTHVDSQRLLSWFSGFTWFVIWHKSPGCFTNAAGKQWICGIFTRSPLDGPAHHTTSKNMRPHRLFVQLNPPFCDQKVFFYGAFRCQSCHKFHNKRQGHSAEMKKHQNTTVLNQQKRTVCVFKCWLNCQNWHTLKLCDHLKKPPTIQRHRGAVPLLRLIAQKRYPSKLHNFLCFSCHIGRTCPVKEFSWSRNSAFFGTKKRPRRKSPHNQQVFQRRTPQIPLWCPRRCRLIIVCDLYLPLACFQIQDFLSPRGRHSSRMRLALKRPLKSSELIRAFRSARNDLSSETYTPRQRHVFKVHENPCNSRVPITSVAPSP